jgi:hypothetical protein
MGLKEDILDDISNSIAKEMDWHIIADVLVSTGWTSIQIKRFRNNEEAVDINLWLEQNCTGEWKNLATRYIFKQKQDAEWFSLRWL